MHAASSGHILTDLKFQLKAYLDTASFFLLVKNANNVSIFVLNQTNHSTFQQINPIRKRQYISTIYPVDVQLCE